ncbi:MAG: hypothetical protein ACI9FN_004080 [Saprospiraceae bacterium]
MSVVGSIYRSLFLLILLSFSCNTSYEFVDEIGDTEEAQYFDWSIVEHIPDSYKCYNEDRIIKVIFKFINSSDTLLKFDREHAIDVANILVSDVNKRLRSNAKMNLPLENDTPVLDAHVTLKLESKNVFIHYDEEPFFRKKGKNSNQYNRDIINKYIDDSGKYLNIFVMPFDPEEIKSGIQRYDKSGIALGSSIKLAGVMDSGQPAWNYGGLLLHELGHALSLRHSWNNNDGCEDTPRHANCWSNTGEAPCNQIESNNFMDYNPHQVAITPCQIIKMHTALASEGTKQHRLLEVNWCEKIEGDTRIADVQHWANPVLNARDIVIERGGVLIVSSWLSMARDTRITVHKGGQLLIDGGRIYNYCKSPWNGIFVHPKGLMKSRNNSLVEHVTLEVIDRN